MVLDHLLTSGVQQAHKEDRIRFTSVTPRPGHFISAEGRYNEGDADDAPEKRAGIFIGPELGPVARGDLVTACAFNFGAHSSEFDKLGRVPVLKARMNADLHMAGELMNTGAGNLFVIFGEPDINAEVWESLNSDTSRPFQKPLSGRIAVKVINHLGDEVMKVFRVR